MSNESTNIIETMSAELKHLRPMEASLEMTEADVKAYKQRIAVLEKEVERLQRYHDAEAIKWLAENQKLKSRIKFLIERIEEQDNAIKWHNVEVLMGKLVGELPNRRRVCGDRCFLVHFQIIQAGQVHDGVMESDFDDDEGFFELQDNMIPVHWCVAPMPPIPKGVIDKIASEAKCEAI